MYKLLILLIFVSGCNNVSGWVDKDGKVTFKGYGGKDFAIEVKPDGTKTYSISRYAPVPVPDFVPSK